MISRASCSRASWLVQVGSCKLARASWLVQVGSCKLARVSWLCKLARASWLVQVGSCKLARVSWLRKFGCVIRLCGKAGDFTGRTLRNAFGKKQICDNMCVRSPNGGLASQSLQSFSAYAFRKLWVFETTKEPSNQPSNRPSNQPSNRPINQPSNRPINQPSTNQAANQATKNQATNLLKAGLRSDPPRSPQIPRLAFLRSRGLSGLARTTAEYLTPAFGSKTWKR